MTEETKSPNLGGAREGAGRPKKLAEPARLTVEIEAALLARLDLYREENQVPKSSGSGTKLVPRADIVTVALEAHLSSNGKVTKPVPTSGWGVGQETAARDLLCRFLEISEPEGRQYDAPERLSDLLDAARSLIAGPADGSVVAVPGQRLPNGALVLLAREISDSRDVVLCRTASGDLVIWVWDREKETALGGEYFRLEDTRPAVVKWQERAGEGR